MGLLDTPPLALQPYAKKVIGLNETPNDSDKTSFITRIGALSASDLLPSDVGVPPTNVGIATGIAAGTIYFNSNYPVIKGGFLYSLSVYVQITSGAGTFYVCVMRQNSPGNFTVVSSTTLNATSVGVWTYNATQLGSISVVAGDFIGVCADLTNGARVGFGTSSGLAGWWLLSAGGSPPVAGLSGNASFQNTGQAIKYSFSTKAPSNGLTVVTRFDLNSDLTTAVATGETAALANQRINNGMLSRGPSYIKYFDGSAPSDWTRTAGWTDNPSGMTSPTGAGDFAQSAYLTNSGFFGENRFTRLVFIPQISGVVFAHGSRLGVSGTGRASLISINGVNNTINLLAEGSTWLTEPAVVTSSSISGLIAGRQYALEMTRNFRVIQARLVDLVTGISWTVTSTANNAAVGYSDGGVGEMFGNPIIINKTGQTLFQNFQAYNSPRRSKVLVIGDSRTHGSGVTLSNRWGQKVIDSLGGLGCVAAIDGGKTDMLTLITSGDAIGLKPDWILCDLGTNDRDASINSYTTNINNLVSYCQANNIQLALAVHPPIPTYGTYTVLNSFVLGLKGVHFLRWDLALTLNNDGVTFVSGNYFGDQIHENATGHNLKYLRAQIDVPALFQ